MSLISVLIQSLSARITSRRPSILPSVAVVPILLQPNTGLSAVVPATSWKPAGPRDEGRSREAKGTKSIIVTPPLQVDKTMKLAVPVGKPSVAGQQTKSCPSTVTLLWAGPSAVDGTIRLAAVTGDL